jgi:hypothetical protein
MKKNSVINLFFSKCFQSQSPLHLRKNFVYTRIQNTPSNLQNSQKYYQKSHHISQKYHQKFRQKSPKFNYNSSEPTDSSTCERTD